MVIHQTTPFVFNEPAIICMKPYNNIITVLDGNITNFNRSFIEFQLMEHAMKSIEESEALYSYVLKVRADNMVHSPIRLKAIYGEGNDFMHRFAIFENSFHLLYKYVKKTIPSWNDILWAWIFTAGMKFNKLTNIFNNY
jgi:hypothetical protein